MVKPKWKNTVITRKILICMAFFFFFASIRGSQEKENELTLDSSNGRYWKAASESQKLGYLKGFYEALRLMDTSDSRCLYIQINHAQQFVSSLNHAEISAELDAFYEEEFRVSFPLTLALFYIASKANGAATQELEKILARKSINNRGGVIHSTRQ